MVDIVIISFALAAIFILLPNVLSFRAEDQNSSDNPDNFSELATVPSEAGAPARVVNLLSYAH